MRGDDFWAAVVAGLILGLLSVAIDTGIILLGWNVFGINEMFNAPTVDLGQALIIAIAFDCLGRKGSSS